MANTENKDPKKTEFKKRMVKALYSYSPVNIDELPLKVNDVLEVIEETEEGWWKGILDGNVGMFPSNFVVELDGLPEDLNNKLTNDLSPTKCASKTKIINQQETLNKQENSVLIENKQEQKQVMNTPDIIDGSSKNITNLLPDKKPVIPKMKPSIDSTAPRLPPKPVREQALVLYPYESRNEDELTLKEGDVITIISKDIEDKGWWKGELNNRVGVFPDNFVRLIKAEEQKKPERPDKPANVLSSKSSSKHSMPEKGASEPSPKIDKKVVKTPPVKPPFPDLNKKEPDRPPPPFPSKKPQPPQPVRKPSRSSKPPISSSQAPAATSSMLKSSRSGSTPSIVEAVAAATSEENTKSSDSKSLPREKSSKDDPEFDAIESTGKKLVHLTASRAKAPNRRPPSFIFLKDTDKDNEVLKDSRRRSEPLLSEIDSLLPLADSEKKNSISSIDIKPKIPPTRPLPVNKSNSFSEPDAFIEQTAKKNVLSEIASILTKEIAQPKVSEVPSKPPPPSSVAKMSPNITSKPSATVHVKSSSSSSIRPLTDSSSVPTATVQSLATVPAKVPKTPVLPPKFGSDMPLAADTEDLGDSMKVNGNNIVTKNEYNALLKQVNDLKDSFEQYCKVQNNIINDLKEKLEEEQKFRHTLQVEMQKIKEHLTSNIL